MPNIADTYKDYYAKDRKSWRKWLEKHHDTAPGIWLVYYKKESGKSRVPYADAVEEALCFGWIDSTTRTGHDGTYYKQLFTHRKQKSGWSKLNKQRIKEMIAQGLMTPSGLEKINAAKKDGSWTKLDAIEEFTQPDELKKALAKNKAAKKFFNGLRPSPKKLLIYWISAAKLPTTRMKRVDSFLEAAANNKLPDHFLPKK